LVVLVVGFLTACGDELDPGLPSDGSSADAGGDTGPGAGDSGAGADAGEVAPGDAGTDGADAGGDGEDGAGEGADADVQSPDGGSDTADAETGADADVADAVEDIDEREPLLEYDPTVETQFAGLAQVQVRYETSATGSFYRAPWPSNSRRRAGGQPDLADFPNPAGVELLGEYVRVVEDSVVGFSNLPVVYAGLTGEFPREGLPDPRATVGAESSVQLVSVGAGNCGRRIPLALDLAARDGYIPAGTLQAAPVDGWVLPPATDWAFVVQRTLGNDAGVTIPPPAEFRAALAGVGDVAWSESLQPLRDCLVELELDPSLLSFATVFTTQDPVTETQGMRRAVLERAEAPVVVQWQAEPEFSNDGWTVYGGTFRAPVFQEGFTPYAGIGDGGGLVPGEDGLPVIQRYEEVPFSIAFPRGAAGPLPVLVWEDGTAFSTTPDRAVKFGHVGDGPFRVAIAAGFAVANFQPPFHAGRSGDAADPVLHSFNFLNPESGRTAFRQQVADTTTFIRLLDEAQGSFEGVPELDTDRMVYGGHSQGAIVGAMVAGVETRFRSYVLNGVGALFSTALVERKDPIDINRTLSGVLGLAGGRLNRFHPVVQLAQMAADPVDPGNYVRLWSGWEGYEQGSSVFMTNGFNDTTTHHTQISTITVASDAAVLAPAG
jgi:hypothetical protein